MTTATQQVRFEIECTGTVNANCQLCDYGVPRSPVWTECDPTSFDGGVVEIAGVEVRLDDLPSGLADAIWDMAISAIEETQWEKQEYDYD